MRIETKLCWSIAIAILAASLCQAQTNESSSDNTGAELSLQHRAEAGNREAQNQLGLSAEAGQDYREAFKWFQLAANQGLSGAQVSLAFFYVMGLGTEKDLDQAFHWYSLAAAQGNPDAEYSVGVCYLHGEGVEQNLTLARKWISSALTHGDGGRSANGMGLTYEHDSPKDYAEALVWYSKAAEMGYGEAQYNVCRLAAQGLANPADYAGALKWCSKLADSGNEWGEYAMGRISQDGVGIQPDFKKAAEWFQKSAEQGNPAAQLTLGAMYSEGKGVKRDLVKAYMWIAVAGSGKHPDALAELESLTANMSKSQISAGQALALKWTQDHPRDPEQNLDHIVYKPE
jgi:TPR repeat protein